MDFSSGDSIRRRLDIKATASTAIIHSSYFHSLPFPPTFNMASDGSGSEASDTELDVSDIPETEIDFDMAPLLEPLIPPPPNVPVAQLHSVSCIFISKFVLI